MLKVLVLLHVAVIGAHQGEYASRRRERGSVTMEHVLWAVAVIGIVGIVVLAITNYVTTEAGRIQ